MYCAAYRRGLLQRIQHAAQRANRLPFTACLQVAIKVLPSEATTNVRERFRKEMATASALRNRNICQFYGASEPHMFIVSELMEGGDLKCAIERDPVNMAWNKRGRQARERATQTL